MVAGRLAKLQNDVTEIGDVVHMLRTARPLVYPDLAAGVVVTANAAGWTLGAFATVVAPAAIGDDFQIVGVEVEAVSAAPGTVYTLELYAGGSDKQIGAARFTGTGPIEWLDTWAGLIAGGDQIRAKLASSNAAADTATVSIRYRAPN